MEIDEEKILPELEAVLTNEAPTGYGLKLRTVYLLMQSCQMLITHPGIGAPLKGEYERIGRDLQEIMAKFTTPNFNEFMEMGWHRENDHIVPSGGRRDG